MLVYSISASSSIRSHTGMLRELPMQIS